MNDIDYMVDVFNEFLDKYEEALDISEEYYQNFIIACTLLDKHVPLENGSWYDLILSTKSLNYN